MTQETMKEATETRGIISTDTLTEIIITHTDTVRRTRSPEDQGLTPLIMIAKEEATIEETRENHLCCHREALHYQELRLTEKSEIAGLKKSTYYPLINLNSLYINLYFCH